MRGFDSRSGLRKSRILPCMRGSYWSKEQLEAAVASSKNIREVLTNLSLKESGGNYSCFKKYVEKYSISTSHFTGRGWRKGLSIPRNPVFTLEEILTTNSTFQTGKLKKRLFAAGLKKPRCEECGWKKMSPDGRLPLELDHVNGIRTDNRLENLRILCPNCHSLKPTHRGSNINRTRRGGETGRHATLKTL